jgi:hypothetical protein
MVEDGISLEYSKDKYTFLNAKSLINTIYAKIVPND